MYTREEYGSEACCQEGQGATLWYIKAHFYAYSLHFDVLSMF